MDRLLLARARYVVAIAAILAGFFVIGLAAQAPSAAAGGPVGGSITPAVGSVLAAPTTAHTGRIHVYDALVIARVHVRTVGTVDLAPAMLGDQWERSAPLPSELRGVSTTSLRSGVATEAAGGAVDDAVRAPTTRPDFANISAKIERQMQTRGWTPDLIAEAVTSGNKFPAVNKLGGANTPATRYVSPTTGQSVVIDNATGEIIQVGGPGFKYGP